MSIIVKSDVRPECKEAIEQAKGVWLCSDDCKEPEAKPAEIVASTLQHPGGHGRAMLRQVPAGMVLIEVDPATAKVVAVVAAAEPIKEKPAEGDEEIRVR